VTQASIEDSPPVENIVRKFDFKDMPLANEGGRSSSGEGKFVLLPKSS
jgi:hypothetical protein